MALRQGYCAVCGKIIDKSPMAVEFYFDESSISPRPVIVDLFTYHPAPHKHYNKKYNRYDLCEDSYHMSPFERVRNGFRKRSNGPCTSMILSTRGLLEAFASYNDTTRVSTKLNDVINHAVQHGLFLPEKKIKKIRYTATRIKELHDWWQDVMSESNYFSETHTLRMPNSNSEFLFFHYKNNSLHANSLHKVDINTVYRNYKYSNSFIETVDEIIKIKQPSGWSYSNAIKYYDKHIDSVYEILQTKAGKTPQKVDIITVFAQAVRNGRLDKKTKLAIIDNYLLARPRGSNVV